MGKSADSAYESQMAALSRVLKELRHSEDAQSAIRLTLDHLQQEFPYDLVWLGRYQADQHRLLTQGCRTAGHQSMRTTFTITPGDLLEQVVVQQRPVVVVDFNAEVNAGAWRPVAQQHSLQSALLFPVKHQGQCVAVVVLGSTLWGLSPSLAERSHLAMVLGTLAATLHHLQQAEQQQRAKRADQPLLTLLGSLGSLDTREAQLKAIQQQVQQFIRPARTRLFWLEAEGNYFGQRLPPLNRSGTGTFSGRLAVDEMGNLHQILGHGQLVVVGDPGGAGRAAVPEPLMQGLKAQALMLSPILEQSELVGFITVESAKPRLWLEVEKQFLRGVGQLAGLILPAAAAQEAVDQMQIDQQLTAGVVQSIYGDGDWQRTLQTCGEQLLQRLQGLQFCVLLFNPSSGHYDLCFHRQSGRTGAVPVTWPCLDDVDWQLLERSSAPVAIDDLGQDFKLGAWRPQLQTMGAGALVVGNVAPGNAPEGIVLVTHGGPRHWSPAERALVEAVGRQIGVILHQWQLQRQMDQQGRVHESVQWGLQALQRSCSLPQLEQITVDQVAALLQVPAVALISWMPGDAMAKISRTLVQTADIVLDDTQGIPVKADVIINWALQTDGILPLTMADLPEDQPAWLAAPAQAKLLLVALRTAPGHHATGVLAVWGQPQRQWTDYHLEVLTLLAGQLAWCRRHLLQEILLLGQRNILEQLNWYKTHRLADFQRQLQVAVERLDRLAAEAPAAEAEQWQRSLQPCHDLLSHLPPLLDQECWRLEHSVQTAPLVSLLTHLLEHTTPLVQERQLWVKVHSDTNGVVRGSIGKIECVLHELLTLACERSAPGGRIDIWCRPTAHRGWLEFSITDHGDVPADVLAALQQDRPLDWLAPSPLDAPPGLNLAICQGLMTELGSHLRVSRLDDGRVYTSVLLAVAAGGPSLPTSPAAIDSTFNS